MLEIMYKFYFKIIMLKLIYLHYIPYILSIYNKYYVKILELFDKKKTISILYRFYIDFKDYYYTFFRNLIVTILFIYLKD